jgi:hypothetical protein
LKQLQKIIFYVGVQEVFHTIPIVVATTRTMAEKSVSLDLVVPPSVRTGTVVLLITKPPKMLRWVAPSHNGPMEDVLLGLHHHFDVEVLDALRSKTFINRVPILMEVAPKQVAKLCTGLKLCGQPQLTSDVITLRLVEPSAIMLQVET